MPVLRLIGQIRIALFSFFGVGAKLKLVSLVVEKGAYWVVAVDGYRIGNGDPHWSSAFSAT